MGHPLFAAVTAVEVRKWDVINLGNNPEKGMIQKGTMETENAMDLIISTPGMMKRFFDSEIPFIAYVRTTGLEQGREEDLLEIVRSQILHVMASYEQNTETRKKEAMSAAEGSLPLESRFLLTTQEDLQRQFALPSWRRKGLEFLSADMVEMRRRKKVERIEREKKMEEKRIHEKKLKELEMEQRAREEQGEKGKDELKDQQQPQQPSSVYQVLTTTTSLTPSQNPIPIPSPNSAPEPEPEPDPYTSDHSDPEQPPSTPAEYFSRRLTRLHNFWTKEAQPADFEFAKAIKRNTLRKWRGERREGYNSKWTTSGNGDDENGREHENVTTTPKIKNIAEWLARIAAQSQRQGQLQTGTGNGRLPGARAGGGRTRRKLTRQQLADFDYSSDSFSSSSSEEEGGLCLADELDILTDASDDEDILRFLGEGDDDDVGDEREDKEEDMHEDEDSYPLVDHVRESMMNKR